MHREFRHRLVQRTPRHDLADAPPQFMMLLQVQRHEASHLPPHVFRRLLREKAGGRRLAGVEGVTDRAARHPQQRPLVVVREAILRAGRGLCSAPSRAPRNAHVADKPRKIHRDVR